MVSREIVDHAQSILGVDISQGMVDYYNKRFADMGLPPEKVHSIIADLKPGHPETVPDELRGKEFDLIFVRDVKLIFTHILTHTHISSIYTLAYVYPSII